MHKAYVVFCDSDAWYLKWLPKNCRHTFVIVHNTTYIHGIETNRQGLSMSCIPSTIEQALFLLNPMEVYEINVTDNKFNYPAAFTCVEVVKRLTGINKWWIITPPQLRRYVRKKGIRYEYSK